MSVDQPHSDGGGALKGLKVVDLSWYVAGPYCTKILAGLGAEVVKVERPGEGDPARRKGPFPDDVPHPERSGLFLFLNTGKKGITLNLKSATGREVLKRLVAEADMVVESFAPGVMDRLGLSYDQLVSINPRLVMTSISNFGQDGPNRDYEATEIVFSAASGIMYINGDQGREPLKGSGDYLQYQAGLHAVIGTLAALQARRLMGEGQHVDVSIAETASHTLQFVVTWYTHFGAIQTRIGSRQPFGHPYTLLPCKDGYVAVTHLPQWVDALTLLTGREEFSDPRFQDPMACIESADEIDQWLTEWLRERTAEEAVAEGQTLRICTDYVYTPAQMLEDPQYQARGYFVTLDHPEAGRQTYPGAPFVLSGTPWRHARAPLLGEHNQEVYSERLGYSREELAHLRETGVI
ncbi:MAG: CaiB/BaiF CoA transferase family protein [Dehalococcoidia bacterium]